MSIETPEERASRLDRLPFESAVPPSGGLGGFLASMRHLLHYRELMGLLVRRELKARYKDSALGFLWSLLRPLAILVVYFVAIGKFLGAERSIPDFAIYIFTGLTAWTLFSEIVAGGTGSIIGNAGLIKKVYLPREVFPLSVVGSALFNFATQLLILAVAVLAVGRVPTGARLFYLPLALAVLVLWATAFALVLSAVNVYLRDVQYLVEISLTVLFWASPVVYSWALVTSAVSEGAATVYAWNPITAAVLGMQRAFWVAGTDQPYPENLGRRLAVMVLVGAVALVLAQRAFARMQANFAQEL